MPKEKKYIIVVAPHTSNWDFFVGIFARFAVDVKIHFLAKKQAFIFPFGPILRFLGGAPVDRTKNENQVTKASEMFQKEESYVLALTPEGTRYPVTRWKEGFYHIALRAKVPIIMVSLDYVAKEVRISDLFYPSGNIEEDFPKIMNYFRSMRGKHPKEIPQYLPRDKNR